MPLPRGDEYFAAVQNPRTAFSDVELKNCKPEADQFGMPKPYAGGFTTTFHLQNHSQSWAARCFTRDIPDLQKRYEAIGRFLLKSSDGFFVRADCLPQGIKVGTQWHPIIKMQWLQGETLNSFLDKNISSSSQIGKLIPEFLNLVHRLEQLGIAHGDLQHGNIIVNNGKLFLVDYDGLYLPELSSLKTNEIGHINYQHPARSEAYYNVSIDRFSSIVIYLGLQALSIAPKLWKTYDNSENVLFRADDFVNVETSPLLKDISAFPQLTQYVDRFRGVCRLDFDKIPNLDHFIAGDFSYPKIAVPKVTPSAVPTALKRSQYPVIDASRTGSLSEHIGDRIEVVGLISTSRRGWARNHRPYVFINFGVYPNHTFTLVLWSTSLATFQTSGANPQAYAGKWVKVSGVIGTYRGKPQMTIETPSQIQVLAGENDARQWLGGQAPISAPGRAQQPATQTGEAVFNTLYAGRTSTPVRTIPAPTTPQKKFDSSHGIVGSIILGIIGAAVWGFWGLVAGALLGYQIAKRL